MRRTKIVLLAPLLAMLGACVSTKAVKLGNGPTRPSLTPDEVAIYRTADQVPGKYEEVGLLKSSGDQSFTNEGQIYKSMRKKAAQMGANGVILGTVKDASTASQIAAGLGFGSANRKGEAVAIFVLPRDSTARR